MAYAYLVAIAPPRNYARNEILPSYEIDVGARHTANLASNFHLEIAYGAPSTALHIPAQSTNGEAAVISIANLRRYLEGGGISASHPGGSAGTYDVYVTCHNDSITSTPSPNTDITDYTFGFVIRPAASPPTGVDQYRKVGTCEWSGTAITQVNQTVGDTQPFQTLAPAATSDQEVPLRIFGASSSQSAPLIRAYQTLSGGTPLLELSPAGALSLPGSFAGGSKLTLGSSAVGFKESHSGHLGVLSGVLDLSDGGATDVSSGTTAGDKIALYGSSSGFGFGVQSNRLVAYMPAGASFAIRQTSGSGQRSSGSDALTLSAAGGIGFYGAAATTQKTGYGSGSQVGTKGALTAASDLNDVIATLSGLVADLRTYGLVGA